MQKLAEGAPMRPPGLSLTYAGFWVRLGAKLLDGVILGVPLLVVVLLLAATGGRSGLLGSDALMGLIQLAFLVANVGYSIFFVGKYGATPGKMACRLTIVMADG